MTGSALADALAWWESSPRRLADLESRLAETVPREELVARWAASGLLSPSGPRSEAAKALFDASLLVLGRAGDLDRIAELLALHVPDRIGLHLAIEFYLASIASPPASGLVPLFRVHAESDVAEARRRAKDALVRARLPVDADPGDDDFVGRCAEWCERTGSQLALNPEYAHKLSSRGGGEIQLLVPDPDAPT